MHICNCCAVLCFTTRAVLVLSRWESLSLIVSRVNWILLGSTTAACMSQANQLLSTNRCSSNCTAPSACPPALSISINIHLCLSLSRVFCPVFFACCLWKMCDKSDPKKQTNDIIFISVFAVQHDDDRTEKIQLKRSTRHAPTTVPPYLSLSPSLRLFSVSVSAACVCAGGFLYALNGFWLSLIKFY